MVEVVEHLEAEVLAAFPAVLFGFYRPRVVVMTTPNSEFNVVFGPDFTGFRHWDHKFEWSRQEFEEWSHGVARHYGYEVEFHGIGDIPEQKKTTKKKKKKKKRRLSDGTPSSSSKVVAGEE